MIFNLVTDDAFVELSILQEKAQAALGCIIDDANCAHIQTLADIASDYLFEMGDTIQAMQKSPVHYSMPTT